MYENKKLVLNEMGDMFRLISKAIEVILEADATHHNNKKKKKEVEKMLHFLLVMFEKYMCVIRRNRK